MEQVDWDVFCRVVDNLGDVGVCWRLAADLAGHGRRVRLFIDDASALRWMAPGGAHGVSVHAWPGEASTVEPAEVVVEAFGGGLPSGVVARMAARDRPPVWIDLEYLSAEGYVERSHGLASPQANGLVKWFYYPGFTRRTGGLIREPDGDACRAAFDAAGWLAERQIVRQPGERVVSLFCYEQPALSALLRALSATPTLLLAATGHAARQTVAALGGAGRLGELRAVALPLLSQRDYDHLLWSCDINFVRGEDSFVRAQWAGVPFVWQAYPQSDGAHRAKVQAFLDLHLNAADAATHRDVERLWHAWNSAVGPDALALPAHADWRRSTERWCRTLLDLPSLTPTLLDFARRKG